jgi:hypothetical protein
LTCDGCDTGELIEVSGSTWSAEIASCSPPLYSRPGEVCEYTA